MSSLRSPKWKSGRLISTPEFNLQATGRQLVDPYLPLETSDTTPPTLSSASASANSHVAYTGAVTTDEGNGTLYYYISTNSSETAATVKASGATQSVSATGVQNVSGSGLSPTTGYYLHFVQTDAAANDSTVLSTSQFFTPSHLYFRSSKDNGITSGGVACYDMLTTQGSTLDTAVVTATASGTDIQWTKTAGGSILVFATGRVPSGGWTITQADIAAWYRESVATVNAGARVRFYKWSGGTETLITGSPFDDGVEFTTTDAEYTWLADVTDTALAEDDRLIVKLYLTNVGTMGAGDATFSFNTDTGSGGTVTPVDNSTATESIASTASTISNSITIAGVFELVVADLEWTHFGTMPTVSTVRWDNNASINLTEVSSTNVLNTLDGSACRRVSYVITEDAIIAAGGSVANGAHTVDIAFSGDCWCRKLHVTTYNNVNQTTPTEGGNTATGATGTSLALAPSTTTVSGDYLHGGIMAQGSAAAITCTDTLLTDTDYSAFIGVEGVTGRAASSGSGNTLDFNLDNSNYLGSVFVIKASTLPATNSYINVYPAVSFKAEGGGSFSGTLTGQSATGSQGSLVYALSKTLSGHAGSGSQGALSYAFSKTLGGQAGAGGNGTITFSSSVDYTGSLTGQSGAGSQGSLVYAFDKSLNGQGATGSQGSVSFSSSADFLGTLTGQLGSGSLGQLSYDFSKSLLGQSASGSLGNITYSFDKSLTGEQATGSQGAITFSSASVDFTGTLTGQQGVGSQGNITYSTDVVGGGGYHGRVPRIPDRTRRISEYDEPELSERDAEIKALLEIAQEKSKKTVKSRKAAKLFELPMLELPKKKVATPRKIVDSIVLAPVVISDDDTEMLLALMMEMM